MWNPGGATRGAVALAMAAAVAFLGSAMMLKAGRALPHLTGVDATDGHPGALLLAIVLAVAGVLLLGMALKELLELRRRPHAR